MKEALEDWDRDMAILKSLSEEEIEELFKQVEEE